MGIRKRFLFVLVVSSLISSPGYCASKISGVSSCEGLNNLFEDLDCIDASQSGAICASDEEIISLPRRFQLCCCLRHSNAIEEPVDEPIDEPSVDDPLTEFPNFRKKR